MDPAAGVERLNKGETFMAIMLKIEHKEGVRLRHQIAKNAVFSEGGVGTGGVAISGTEWAFEGEDCQRDIDDRRRDNRGKPMLMDSYTVYISANTKNLVIEKKGKPEPFQFRNASLRNLLKIRTQEFADTGRKDKTGKPIKEWKTIKTEYLPANEWGGVFAGDGVRAILDEMPT